MASKLGSLEHMEATIREQWRSWTSIDAAEARVPPTDLQCARWKNKDALEHFGTFASNARELLIGWVLGARTSVTPERRIPTAVELAARNIRANGQTAKACR